MATQRINPNADLDSIDLILRRSYRTSYWALRSSLGMMMIDYQSLPSKEVRKREKVRRERAEFFKNIKLRILRFESGKSGSCFDEVAFQEKYPALYNSIEEVIMDNKALYRLEKLKQSNPEKHKEEREWYEKYANEGNLIPRKPRRGRYPRFPYLVGAVWSGIIKGKRGRVHWGNIRNLMEIFYRDLPIFKSGELSLKTKGSLIRDLMKQSKDIRKSHPDWIERILTNLAAFPYTGFPAKARRSARRPKS